MKALEREGRRGGREEEAGTATFLMSLMKSSRFPWMGTLAGPLRSLLALTLSSFMADRQRA